MESQQICIICCNAAQVIGLLPCSHKHICYACYIKLCDGGFYCCPICKAASQTLLFTDNLHEDYDRLMSSKNVIRSDINRQLFFSSKIAKNRVERESLFICSFPQCKTEYKTLNILKKHLNQAHKRQFCQLCLDNRKCLLSQQILYTDPQLNCHLSDGQVEDNGIVSLYHPYCQFCRQRYYDEQLFLKHMKTHETCFICNKQPEYKYTYYKDYKTLENHFERSHYVCKHNNCLDKKLTNVFATEALRDYHYAEAHLGQNFSKKDKKKRECIELTGFFQQQEVVEEAEPKVKDGLGKDCSGQLMSISKKVQMVSQPHIDGYLDFREIKMEKSLLTKHLMTNDIVNRVAQAVEYFKEQPITVNEIDYFRPLHMTNLTKNLLNSLLDDIFPYQQANYIKKRFYEAMQGLSYEEYCQEMMMLTTSVNPIHFYYVFPQLIRFFQDANPRKKYMDSFYLARLHQLPISKIQAIHLHKTYNQFIRNFKNIFTDIVQQRIVQNKIDIKQYLKIMKSQEKPQAESFHISKDKIKNMLHMIDKCKMEDVLKLSWLLKLGMSPQTFTYVTKTVYFMPPDDVPKALEKIKNPELALFYSYFSFLQLSIVSKDKFNFEKVKEDNNIIKGVLAKFKDKYTKNQQKIVNEIMNVHPEEQPVKKVRMPIKEEQLPSLPTTNKVVTQSPNKSNVQVGFGKTGYMKKWNEEEMVREVEKEENPMEKFYDAMIKKKGRKTNEKKPQKKELEKQPEKKELQKQPERKEPEKSTPNKHKTLSYEQQLQLVLEESKRSYDEQVRKREEERPRMVEKPKLIEKPKETKKPQESKRIVEQVKKESPQPNKKKAKNIFEQQQFEEEQIRMKKELKKKKQDKKQQQKITLKTLEEELPAKTKQPIAKVVKKQPKNIIAEEEFPQLEKSNQSWIAQVAGKPKDPVLQEVKVRKKKGRTTIEQTVDIFGKP